MPVSVVAGTRDRAFVEDFFPQSRHQEHLKTQKSPADSREIWSSCQSNLFDNCFNTVAPTISTKCLPSPSTRAVPHSSSSPILLFPKKLLDTASSQRASNINGVFVEQLRPTRSTKAVRFRKTASVFFEGPSCRQQPGYSVAKNHEATCLSSHPRQRELSPTARRRPLCCPRRNYPTLLQPVRASGINRVFAC